MGNVGILGRSPRVLGFACCALLLLGGSQARAQRAEDAVGSDRFTQRSWSQIRPNRDYLNGCVTGYRAFSFSRTGHFVFNRKVHGSWRVDPFGNLILRARDGTPMKLVFDRQRVLSPTQDSALLRRQERYQECPD